MATVSANKLELLQIADAVAREKAIDRKIVLGAMEDAIAKAARSRYGSETEVRAEIEKELKAAPETWGEGAKHLDMAELRHIMMSQSFRVLVSGMALLGVAFNLVFAYRCWRLVRRPSGGFRLFLVLMVGFALYVYLLPRVVVATWALGSTVAAAWGVGNMGLAPLLFTRYWLWGTIFVVAGTRASRNP